MMVCASVEAFACWQPDTGTFERTGDGLSDQAVLTLSVILQLARGVFASMSWCRARQEGGLDSRAGTRRRGKEGGTVRNRARGLGRETTKGGGAGWGLKVLNYAAYDIDDPGC